MWRNLKRFMLLCYISFPFYFIFYGIMETNQCKETPFLFPTKCRFSRFFDSTAMLNLTINILFLLYNKSKRKRLSCLRRAVKLVVCSILILSTLRFICLIIAFPGKIAAGFWSEEIAKRVRMILSDNLHGPLGTVMASRIADCPCRWWFPTREFPEIIHNPTVQLHNCHAIPTKEF